MIRRRARVRPVARRTIVSGAWMIAALAACGDPAQVESVITDATTTAHYAFHSAAGDSVDVEWQEAFHAWVSAELEITEPRRLEYFKYRDRAHLASITGRSTNGFAEPGTLRFHTIWPIDNHEGVHTLVLLHLGHPPALFNEGVAVAHQTDPFAGDLVARWSGQDIHDLARTFLRQRRIPALTALLRSPDFFSHSDAITYPTAGSFVRWLLDRYGLGAFRALLAGASFDDPAETTRQRFQTAYGMPLEDAWTAWQSWLEMEGS